MSKQPDYAGKFNPETGYYVPTKEELESITPDQWMQLANEAINRTSKEVGIARSATLKEIYAPKTRAPNIAGKTPGSR